MASLLLLTRPRLAQRAVCGYTRYVFLVSTSRQTPNPGCAVPQPETSRHSPPRNDDAEGAYLYDELTLSGRHRFDTRNLILHGHCRRIPSSPARACAVTVQSRAFRLSASRSAILPFCQLGRLELTLGIRNRTDTLWTDPSLRILAPMKALPSLTGRDAATSPSRAASAASPLVSSTAPPASEDPSPTDLLLATPPALIKLFALSAPIINVAATFALLVTWKHPNFWGSLLVLLGWWGVCLFGYWVAVYGLNAAILAFILVDYLSTARRGNASAAASLRHRPRPATLSPSAYAQLLVSASVVAEHVQAFRTSVVHPLSLHFSFSPLRPSTPAPAYDTAWFLVTSYPFYLALTFFVPVKYLFLALGTVAILWQAPFFATLRSILWRSAFIRWICHLLVGVLRGGKGVRQEWRRTRSGLGIPGLIGTVAKKEDSIVIEERPVKLKKRSSSTTTPVLASSTPAAPPSEAAASSSTPAVVAAAVEAMESPADDIDESSGEDVEVQFTVFENQRWWVGLDWTQALLPGERASW